jgi:molecular chaperone DnaK
MVNLAEKMKGEDQKRRELVDLKNEADTSIHTTERSLSEHKSKLTEQDIQEIESEVQNLKNLLAESNLEVEPLKEAIEKVK